jgi:2-hydroxy-3-oxopropionate reductase
VNELVDAGAARAEVPAAVAEASDITITMLPDTTDVEQVLTGEGGVVDGVSAGSLVIDMSSIDPGPTRAMAMTFGPG